MKKFFEEFKTFISRGNVMDMAIGVIIGGAFGKIVTSLVNDVIMPLISKATGGVSFTDMFVNNAEIFDFQEGIGMEPGDVNGDGEINIADINALIDVILSGEIQPAADVNGDGEVNIADINAVIDIILQ